MAIHCPRIMSEVWKPKPQPPGQVLRPRTCPPTPRQPAWGRTHPTAQRESRGCLSGLRVFILSKKKGVAKKQKGNKPQTRTELPEKAGSSSHAVCKSRGLWRGIIINCYCFVLHSPKLSWEKCLRCHLGFQAGLEPPPKPELNKVEETLISPFPHSPPRVNKER